MYLRHLQRLLNSVKSAVFYVNNLRYNHGLNGYVMI